MLTFRFGYGYTQRNYQIRKLFVTKLVPPAVPHWRMILLAVSPDGCFAFIAVDNKIYTYHMHFGLLQSSMCYYEIQTFPKIFQINQPRFEFLHGRQVLIAVSCSGLVHVFDIPKNIQPEILNQSQKSPFILHSYLAALKKLWVLHFHNKKIGLLQTMRSLLYQPTLI
ncbi:MAG: hypothetical protein EZS28_003743 [Streblomastix strix]|uniref:Uncharacterized protein n=1 Tax=Streblomastix strix TaxID=222440 RepID=A0A5J4X2Q5_9EUKA|nr:MAG: hypothetical protein EZS28_003743 [Streblomastix strix]